MSQSTLTVCQEKIKEASEARKIKGLSQNKLAHKLGVASSRVNKFFKGEAITAEIFCNICEYLELDVEQPAGISQASRQVSEELAPQNESLTETVNIDELVQAAREKIGFFRS